MRQPYAFFCLVASQPSNTLARQPIAKNALTILINLTSHDDDILKSLAEDDAFLLTLLKKVTNKSDTAAHLTSQLLANLSKSPALDKLLTLELPAQLTPTTNATTNGDTPHPPRSPIAINQLLDLFVSGASSTSTDTDAHFDYLSYLLADLSATHAAIRTYFLTPQPYDSIIPLSKIVVFTEHTSPIRRRGVASTIKNVCFEVEKHDVLLDEDKVNILSYLLLPLCGNEEFKEEEMRDMLPDLQLLPPDKEREKEMDIITIHVESLMLLTTTEGGREKLRGSGVYAVVRVLHEKVEDEGVREVCERLVNVLMRDEEGDRDGEGQGMVEDREVEEVF